MTYKKTNARAFSIHLHRCMLLFMYVGFQLLMKVFFFFFFSGIKKGVSGVSECENNVRLG